MKLKLHLIAEFDAQAEHYDEFTPECVLATEERNLEEMSPYIYITVFDEHRIVTKLEVIS